MENTYVIPRMPYYRMKIYSSFQMLKKRKDRKSILKFKRVCYSVLKYKQVDLSDVFRICDRMLSEGVNKQLMRQLTKAVERLMYQL